MIDLVFSEIVYFIHETFQAHTKPKMYIFLILFPKLHLFFMILVHPVSTPRALFKGNKLSLFENLETS
jgi:hypothetical protein